MLPDKGRLFGIWGHEAKSPLTKSGSYGMDSYDKNRRTMCEALQTGKRSDEAVAFVTGATKPSNNERRSPVQQPGLSATAESKTPTNPGCLISQTNNLPTALAGDLPGSVPGTVSMTFRLPADLSARLIRVSAERKVRRERPFSQQDIIIEALTEWLYQHRHYG